MTNWACAAVLLAVLGKQSMRLASASVAARSRKSSETEAMPKTVGTELLTQKPNRKEPYTSLSRGCALSSYVSKAARALIKPLKSLKHSKTQSEGLQRPRVRPERGGSVRMAFRQRRLTKRASIRLHGLKLFVLNSPFLPVLGLMS